MCFVCACTFVAIICTHIERVTWDAAAALPCYRAHAICSDSRGRVSHDSVPFDRARCDRARSSAISTSVPKQRPSCPESGVCVLFALALCDDISPTHHHHQHHHTFPISGAHLFPHLVCATFSKNTHTPANQKINIQSSEKPSIFADIVVLGPMCPPPQ